MESVLGPEATTAGSAANTGTEQSSGTLPSRHPTVAVLLSTFNGARYLEELLASVVSQECVEVSVLVRDDGSTDETLQILREWAGRRSRFRVIQGDNVGFNRSFFELLKAAPPADFYAFADQDDVWLRDKLQRATQSLSALKQDVPALWGSTTLVVNEELTPVPYRKPRATRPSLENALVENIIPGHTAVLNPAAREAVLSTLPLESGTFDSWTYKVVAAAGTVIRDFRASVLYRQHPANAIGHSGRLHRLAAAVARFARRDPVYSSHAEHLLSVGSAWIPGDRQAILRSFLAENGLRSRVFYIRKHGLQRSRQRDRALFTLLYLLRKI